MEDRRVQARVTGVEDEVGTLGAGELHNRRLVARVDGRRGEAIVAEAFDRRLRAPRVDVGEDEPLEESAAAGDGGRGSSHAARADDEYAHGGGTYRGRLY